MKIQKDEMDLVDFSKLKSGDVFRGDAGGPLFMKLTVDDRQGVLAIHAYESSHGMPRGVNAVRLADGFPVFFSGQVERIRGQFRMGGG